MLTSWPTHEWQWNLDFHHRTTYTAAILMATGSTVDRRINTIALTLSPTLAPGQWRR